MTFRRVVTVLALAVVAGFLAIVQMRDAATTRETAPTAVAGAEPIQEDNRPLKPRPKVTVGVAPGEVPPADEAPTGRRRSDEEEPPPDDEQIRRDIRPLRELLAATGAPVGARARVLPDGTAVAPRNAPGVVRAIIAAGNEIATTPYRWGGGHGAWRDSGYDCSGSVSFALAGAGLLNRPMTSGGFMNWGRPGRGRWVTIYASPGHMFMVVAGLRFDTSGRSQAGTRWQNGMRGAGGMSVRHPPGL